jgi:tol-pal system protein YbgF
MQTVRNLFLMFGLFIATAVQAESFQSQLDVLSQLEEIRTELQMLRGQVEVTQHELAQLEQRQRDYYDDLNQRLAAQQSKPATTTPTTTTPSVVAPPPAVITTPTKPTTPTAPGAYHGSEGIPAPAPNHAPGAAAAINTTDTTAAVAAINNAGSDLAAYQAAYQLLQNKQYTEAIAGFNAYLTTYPQGEYIANVDYWLGEVYLIQHQYPQAEQAFSRVVTQYPEHQKSADAMLKLGYVYEASGDSQKALTAFEQVQQKYPNTAVAQLAQTKAAQLKQTI